MENFRSMSCREGRSTQLENYNNNNNNNNSGGTRSKMGPPTSMQEIRSYSTNSYQVHPQQSHANGGINKKNKGSSSNNNNNNSNNNNNVLKGWNLNDPELQRKKRVASYKVYGVEGKLKGSIRKSFRWIKHIVYGWT